jgi:RimJ/RimL family protein N-acetyltransferase
MASGDLSIRQYRPSDKEEVYSLHKLALGITGSRPYEKRDIPPEWNDSDFDDIEGTYLKGGEFLVGEIGGKIVAMGAIRRKSDDVCELKRMRVDPDFQGRGYAQRILTLLEDRAGQLGYKKIVLGTTARALAAQKMYLKNGYAETGRRRVEAFNTELLFYEKEL